MELTAGRRYRIVKEGAYLTGMQPVAYNAQQGWKQPLEVGTILTCKGRSMTFGDGVPVFKWADADGKWLANDCELKPNAPGCSMWTQKPDPDYLEEVV